MDEGAVPTPSEVRILVQFLGTGGPFGELPIGHHQVHCPKHPFYVDTPLALGNDARKVHVSFSRRYSIPIARGLPIVNLGPASAEQVANRHHSGSVMVGPLMA